MPELNQDLFNWILSGFGAIMGFLLNSIWQAVKDLQAADQKLTEKVAAIEVLVAGDYVRKDDFTQMANAIFAKLDRMEDKLDRKVDR